MKKSGLSVLLILLGIIAQRSQAQVGVYGQVTASKFTNPVGTTWPVGFTGGILVEGRRILHNRLQLAGDIQGRFLNSSGYNYNGLAVGARAYVPLSRGLRPYAEVAVGYARLQHTPDYPSASTDSQLQFNGGAMKKITPHIDLSADFSYSQYYAFGGEYNPKAVSAGVVYYFNKR
jgi:hypothetical protein